MAYNNSDVRVLGDVELSGALSFSKNYTDFPANPKPHTLVVKDGVTYLYTELVNNSGFFSWQPIGLKQTSYLHTQGLASTTWTVNHGFNSNDFAYFVYDENHNLVFANIEIIDLNTARIVLSSAMTGTAVFFSIEYVNTQNLRASTSATIGSVELTAPSGQLLVGGAPVALVSDLGNLSTLATDANAYTDAAVATIKNSITGTFAGPLAAITGTSRYYPPADIEIKEVYFSVGAVTAGSSVVIDVKKSGVSIFGATKPTVTSGNYQSTKISLSVAVTTSDYLTIDILSAVGNAADATVVISYIYTTQYYE